MRTAPDPGSEVISGKAPTGIGGFDGLTGGGLPRGRTTLLLGGPGSGKTIFAMQFLAHGAREEGEPGIFVAFEEAGDHVVANLEGFGWGLQSLRRDKLFIVEAQPPTDLIRSGSFDLDGMFAALEAQIEKMGARRIVFDAVDVLLALMPDDMSRRHEIYRLHEWLLARAMTALITVKADGIDASALNTQPYGFMQFMVDCSVVLNHRVALGVSQRNLRVQKYRSSAFDENEAPFVIGKHGFEVAVSGVLGNVEAAAGDERLTSGVERLDTMLGGGYYRSASVLITGFPGTAKTTLAGAFAEASCERGERTLFVSFDSDSTEIMRNLTSVNIHLERFAQSGVLRMMAARTVTGSAETLLVRIKAHTEEHGARCLVIDPVSTMSKAGNELTAHGVAERLIDWAKGAGITLVCTSLLDEMSGPAHPGTPLQISTLADTWIHLNYVLQSGERNRGMSIIKSRGTPHSNQVRELILSDAGVTLADIYTAGGEVLMGTLRWEKERAERHANELADLADQLKRDQLDAEQAELEARLLSVQAAKALLARDTGRREEELQRSRMRIRELRGADAASGAPIEESS